VSGPKEGRKTFFQKFYHVGGGSFSGISNGASTGVF